MKNTTTQTLQQLLIKKDYQSIAPLLQHPPSSSSPTHQLLHKLSTIRYNLYMQTSKKQQKWKPNFSQTQKQILSTCQQFTNKIHPTILLIYRYSMQAFLFQIQTDCNDQPNRKEDLERKFLKDVVRLPEISGFVRDGQVQELVKGSLYFCVSLLELYVKKNTRVKSSSQLVQLNILLQLIELLSSKSKQCLLLCKRLYLIVIHLKLHNLNTFPIQLQSQLIEYLDICIKANSQNRHTTSDNLKNSNKTNNNLSNNQINKDNQQQILVNADTVVVLLYTCLKIMLGLNSLGQALVGRLTILYKIFNMSNVIKSYSSHILHMFFIIKISIFKQKQNDPYQSDNNQQKLSQFSQKFSIFLNMNLDEIIVALNQITRNIIRHKVASLSTIMGIKLDIFRFSKDFLEIMHDSPFNNDVQTIKLCFQLFEFREYQKIQNLLQTVLSVPATKQLKMREVLVAMCSIITGLRLSHRQEALLYNKLNHENFLSTKKYTKKSQILKQQTFLQHVGFGYYNMACHQVYLENRQIYLTKALQNFNSSYQLNKQNYLLNYCMSKTYLQLYDLPNAYKHAMQACRSHRGAWAPFCLLACVYICDRKFHKSFLLIEELLKKYNDEPVLHYARAYLEVNKILLDVEHDQEIQAAKMLGEEYYIGHFQRLLKHRPVSTLIQYCQNYYQLSMKQPISEPQENFFSSQNLSNDSENTVPLLNILPLLYEVHQYSTMQSIMKLLPQSNIETQYYKSLLLLRRKQTKQAISQLQSILKINHSHTPTLIKLAQLPKDTNPESYKECLEYLEIAGKYVNDGEFMLAKGIVLSWLGRYDEADNVLLTSRDVGWCAMLPDLMYYY